MIVCAASNNAGKLKELRRILERMGHEVKSLRELGINLDPEETGTTFAENARIKAEAFCKASGLPTVADDSGLCTDALHGAPGVYSARYAGHHGDDDANNAKLLRELADVPEEQRGAKFVSAVCFMLPDGRALEVDKYVNEAMVANGYVLGGEQSGHIIFSKHATTGDGILTALMLMEVILEKKQSLGTLCKGMQMFPQLLKNVRVEDKAAAVNHPRVQEEVKAITEALGDDGRILLRESGTEPVVRVMVEAKTDELCEKYVNQMIHVMKRENLIIA